MRTTLLALGLFLSLSASAQQPREAQPLDVSKVPLEARKPEDFVPEGWKVEATAKGDLDKNGSEDVVLQLIEKPTPGVEEHEDRGRALLVLLAAEGGKLRRVGASSRVLYCMGCQGMMGGGEGSVVKIQKGVLLVDQYSGSRETQNTLLRFRYDAKEGRMVLIGQDVTMTDRLTGESTLESTNTLTGQRVIEKRKYDQKKDKHVVVSSKREKVAVKKKCLEDVDIENL